MYRTRRLVEPLGLVRVDTRGVTALHEIVSRAESAVSQGDWSAVGTRTSTSTDGSWPPATACTSPRCSRVYLAELRLGFLRLPDAQALHEPFLQRNRRLLVLLEAGDLEGAVAELDDYLVTAEANLLEAVRAR